MNPGHLVILYSTPKTSQLILKWQIIELIRKRVLGFKVLDSKIVIFRSAKRQKNEIATDLEEIIDQGVSSKEIAFTELLKDLETIRYKTLIESVLSNYQDIFEKRQLIDYLSGQWRLSDSSERLKNQMTEKIQHFVSISRKRNIEIETTLYKEGVDIHQNILELIIVIKKLTQFKMYNKVLDKLIEQAFLKTGKFELSEIKSILEVSDWMLNCTPNQEKLTLGLEGFVETNFSG